jgi:hypothetical protein
VTTKPFSLRTAVITGGALLGGSGAGTLAEAIAQRFGLAQPGVGQLAASATALWMIAKLDAIIAE